MLFSDHLTTDSSHPQIRTMLNDSITFVVGGEPVYAHKALLVARSDWFRTMFTSGMREAMDESVEIEGVGHAAFMAVMRHLYGFTGDEVEPCLAVEVYALADQYILPRLKNRCFRLVCHGLSVNNAASVLNGAEAVHASEIREIAMEYVVRHFDDVCRTDAFPLLTKDLIVEILRRR